MLQVRQPIDETVVSSKRPLVAGEVSVHYHKMIDIRHNYNCSTLSQPVAANVDEGVHTTPRTIISILDSSC